jgi:SAM-dependent methyltransferase
MVNDEFLSPVCSPYSLDYFHARRAIAAALTRVAPSLCGTVLDIGCGQMPYKPLILSAPSRANRYLGLDLAFSKYYLYAPDLTWDGRTIPLPDSSIDCALATEVLEHCPEPSMVLSEVSRVLKPSGLFFATVPFLWPLHDVPNDEYRYTPFCIQRLLAAAGFDHIQIAALGGWDASLAQMLGLWVRRRPMSERHRRILQRLVLPFYRWLTAHDIPPQSFVQCEMITGMAITAKKANREPCQM